MDIIETIKSSISPTQLNAVASSIGATPEATQRAMSGAIPALLGGVVHQGETTQGAAGLIEMMKRLPIFGGPGDLLGGKDDTLQRTGSSILGQLFGGDLSAVISRIASFAGMNNNSAQGLMTIAAPVVLGSVAKTAPPGGFTPSALMSALQSQKNSVLNALPTGLSGLAGALGITGLGKAAAGAARNVADAGGEVVRGGTGWVPWVLGALAIAAIAVYALSTCSTRDMALNSITLPGGGTVNVRTGSIGDQLYQFLSGTVPAPQAFTFDNLDFNSGQISYTPGSQPTIDAIASILTAFPNTVVRVEGFTDSEGDDTTNQSLSQARAEMVGSALIAKGVSSSRISAAGLGETRPIADNTTEAGRAQNRRIELVVVQK